MTVHSTAEEKILFRGVCSPGTLWLFFILSNHNRFFSDTSFAVWMVFVWGLECGGATLLEPVEVSFQFAGWVQDFALFVDLAQVENNQSDLHHWKTWTHRPDTVVPGSPDLSRKRILHFSVGKALLQISWMMVVSNLHRDYRTAIWVLIGFG